MLHYHILPVTPFMQNCAILWDDNQRAAILDPGGEADRILDFVKKQELTVEKILITHAHLDHIGAANILRTQLNVPIIGSSREDQALYEMLPQMCEMFGWQPIPAFLPNQWLAEGESVLVGDERLDVVFLPGHSPGHIGFLHSAQQLGFTGDVLFNQSIGRTDLYGGDFDTLIQSIKTKLFPLADDFQIFPGHGSPTTIGAEKRFNPFLR